MDILIIEMGNLIYFLSLYGIHPSVSMYLCLACHLKFFHSTAIWAYNNISTIYISFNQPFKHNVTKNQNWRSRIGDMELWDAKLFLTSKSLHDLKVKNNFKHVTTQRILNKFNEIKKYVGCMVCPWCCLLQRQLPLKILIRLVERSVDACMLVHRCYGRNWNGLGLWKLMSAWKYECSFRINLNPF